MYLLVGPPSERRDTEKAAGPKQKERRQGGDTKGGGSPAPMSARDASDELARWLDRAGTDEGYERLKELIPRAAEWSPETTMEQLVRIEDPSRRREALACLFRHWIGSDQEAALRAIAAFENVALRRDLFREAMSRLSEENPIAAVALLEKSEHRNDQELWSRAFGTWARMDREAAVKRILAIEDVEMRGSLLRSVAQRLAEADLAKAVAWAETVDPEHRAMAMAGVLAQAAGTRPQTVAEHLDTLPDRATRREIIERAAHKWAEHDPDAALAWAETLPERERELAITRIASTVLSIDPEQAEEMLALIPSGDSRREVLGQIARLRASVNVQEAITWIGTLPAEDQSRAWSETAREWARDDPRAVAKYAATVADPTVHQHFVEAASSTWSERDPAEAAQWARSLNGQAGSEAMHRIVDAWAREDPAAAGSFVAGSLDGDLQTSAARQVVERWMKEDMAEAGAWIDSLPDGGTRDGAVHALVGSIEREFPEAALQWVRTIGDDQRREEAERRILRRLGE